MSASTPAERHREVGARFGAVVDGVSDWEVPAPPEGWVARDVVRHLIDWLPGLLEHSAGVVLEPGTSVDEDPVAAWNERYEAVQALLEQQVADRAIRTDHFTGTLAGMIDAFWTGDLFLHTWDLARSSGQDDRLDEATCTAMLEGMAPIDELLRSSGQYGPKVAVPADAPVQDQLIGFIGRDPHWRP